MVSCKVCITRFQKAPYSVELKYANSLNPVHTPLYFADDAVKSDAAQLFRKSLIGYDDDLMRMYNCEKGCFVDDVNPSEDLCIAYTGAKKLTKSQVLDCINKLLIGIYNKDIDGELLVEINGTIVESWRSTPFDKVPRSEETLQKEENIIRYIILS